MIVWSFRRSLKWLKLTVREYWLEVNNSLTLTAFRRRLRSRSKKNQHTSEPGNLLYVIASSLPFHISGYTTRTHEVICAFKAADLCVHVLTRPGYPWDRKDRLCDLIGDGTELDGVFYQHVHCHVKSRSLLSYSKQAAEIVEKIITLNRVAVIQAASNHVNALPALLAAKRLGLPFIYEMRGLWELTRISRQPEFMGSTGYRLGLALEMLVARNASQVLVISEQLKQYVHIHFGVPEERIKLLPNCVDLNSFPVSSQIGLKVSTIAYAGSLIEYEGLDVLLQATVILRGQGVQCLVCIAGDGEARPKLEAMVEQLNLQSHVLFLGKLSPIDARRVVAGAEVVCIPRKPYEVCKIVPPIKLVEAMAMAKPVVVPDLPVFRDELGPDSPGLFFRSGDAIDLARVLKEALANPEEMRVLGLRARAYVEQHRSWEPHIRNVLDTMNLLTSKVKVG